MTPFWRRLFNIEKKNNPTHVVINKANYQDVKWTEKSFADLSEAGYKNCMAVFSCVNLIAKTSAGIEFQLEDKKGNEIEKHPLLDLLARPNKMESKRTLITKHVSYLLLNGNAYPLVVKAMQEPRFMYSMRPDRVQVLPGSGFELVRGYRYTVGSEYQDFLLAQERDHSVRHLKLFHPLDDYYGYGMVAAASRGVDISNLTDAWNAKILTNDMRPAGAFVIEGSLTDQQFNRMKDLVNEEFSGSENAGKPLLMEGGLKFTPFSFTQKELDWLQGDKINSRKICSVFGVAPELIGDSEAKTYSNYGEARRSLYTDIVLPMMSFIVDEWNAWLVPMYGDDLVLKLDTEAIEALQEDRAQKFAYLTACDFLTVNEKRLAMGYGEYGPEADVILVQLGRIPLEQQVAEPEPIPEPLQDAQDEAQGEDEDGDDESSKDDNKSAVVGRKVSFWANRERKEQLWKSFEVRVKTRERSFEYLAKQYLAKQAAEVQRKASVTNDLMHLEVSDLLDIEVEAKRYFRHFYPWYKDHFRRAMEAGIRASKGNLLDEAELKADNPTSWVSYMDEELEAELRDLIFNSGTQVNKTALETIFQELKKANANNMTVEQFAHEIYSKLEDFTPWKARLWART
ncbi:phage portal protein, partial [Candidatus Pacearchaeota archaeon]|nr:phage portal protein [Candidatus Pacearchaeota archaeon]